ncbi:MULTISPECIES: ATP-binding protein [unclassified Pseudodesulfovibrio]|uniref:PAS domain-containing sensor histidine kinase n=1 Tax=unclassified Pseudodesulfovibrio TaxID=2661612 RepID=UPI000FEBE6F7|nr:MULTISPECIES: ATP-binding protein [unclassified Pseudodesulfovibrio]MCJ2164809.1 ATP-binding protein [Pseudodesulfovibrio sp. S3-i]RWU03819.1 GHKL domain-containing protein [Pseudodesulfovibrio sp. S3]
MSNPSLTTHFASPERDSLEVIRSLAGQLQQETTLSLLNAVPMGVVLVNRHRQIVFCNDLFRQLSLKNKEEVLGLRPGEALDCVNSCLEKAGCGCSIFCDVCGAAKAIVKSLDGTADCEECRMVRRVNETEMQLDLQIFTRPFNLNGQSLTLVFTMDISHELRLRYLNRTFYHGLINGVGGISMLTELIEAEPEDTNLFPLLVDSSRRTLKEVLYHRDLYAAETDRLNINMALFKAKPYLENLIGEECRFKNTQPSCVEMKLEDDISLFSDKRLLGHVLRNMLDNALEARENNPGRITLSCRRSKDGRTTISLENPGLIPEDIQKELFKRYVSTKSRDRGLGTYVIKLLTETYLNGKVNFNSRNGMTTFEIMLPSTTRTEA